MLCELRSFGDKGLQFEPDPKQAIPLTLRAHYHKPPQLPGPLGMFSRASATGTASVSTGRSREMSSFTSRPTASA